ncbi:RNA methyltransferase [Niabella yanshanensis]|uniref:RNA methyltransferase n=1 Tax=Niabella yanshanensis TaxID=577386 RepID=A0ABZ0WD11_9BACT|nr:RNA methyltransferase [Niabella yanshanensis]WQD40556.1 RNA methyltransferase [Niabella yanshanensis]
MLNKSEVKYIQSLSQKKFRDEEGVYLAEGPKIVGEALTARRLEVKKIYALQEWLGLNEELCKNVDCEAVAGFELEKISQLKTPNQVLAIVAQPGVEHFKFKTDRPGIILDGIQDPGNLGTIIRIADWFGVHQVICSKDCADAYNSKVVQATMGSIFRVKLLYTDLESWMDAHKELAFYGAALNGAPLKNRPAISNGLVVIGNESKGIRPEVMNRLTERITIEKWGDAESLNAAVATGIILSHLRG